VTISKFGAIQDYKRRYAVYRVPRVSGEHTRTPNSIFIIRQ